MSNTLRETFIRHQLEAVADDLAETYPAGQVLRVEPAATVLGPSDAVAGHLLDLFFAAFDAGLPLCDHVLVPARTAWVPGMPNFGCALELIAYPAVSAFGSYCNYCGAEVGVRGLAPVLVVAGPVLINGAVCANDCLHQRARLPYDPADARHEALELVVRRFLPAGPTRHGDRSNAA